MALIAEQVVEEWLVRQGYFTMRGLKTGVDEIDLLAIKNIHPGQWENWHIEVQVSIRPVSYISGLTSKRQNEFEIPGTNNAKIRSSEQLELTVNDWVNKKYLHIAKSAIRKTLIHSEDWKYMFVHGNVKNENELSLIRKWNIKTIHIKEILEELRDKRNAFTAGSATDIIELIKLLE